MATTTVAVDVLREYEREPTGHVRGDTPERPWLGLDVDDVLAGEPFPVAAQLLGTDGVEGAVAWLRITPDDGDTPAGPRVPLRMSGSGGRWEATVPALAPGRYRLTVETVNVPRVDQLDGRDVVGVIEG